MQRLKLKRIRKKSDMPERRTVNSMGFTLNKQYLDISVEITDKVFVTNHSNGKIYQLINEID